MTDSPSARQIRDSRVLGMIFGHVQTNRSGMYAAGDDAADPGGYSHLCMRAHEHYFVRSAVTPVVFNDLQSGELRHLCPDQKVAESISMPFDPAALRLCGEGRLYHPVITSCGGQETAGDQPREKGTPERALALIESTTSMRILADGDGLVPDAAAATGYRLAWGGAEYELLAAADVLEPLPLAPTT